jgi:hypothetical protein
LGEDPHKVTCILHSHHSPLPCIKKEKKEKNLLFTIQLFSPLLDDSVYPFMLPFSVLGMLWFRSFGFTSFKLSVVLSLKFECNDHASMGL